MRGVSVINNGLARGWSPVVGRRVGTSLIVISKNFAIEQAPTSEDGMQSVIK